MRRVQVTPGLYEYLQEKKIFLSGRNNLTRQIKEIRFHDDSAVEPYVCLMSGQYIPRRMGMFSYSNSDMKARITVGRYSSIGPGLTSHGYQHPLTSVSTSAWIYSPEFAPVEAYLADKELSWSKPPKPPQKPWPVIGNDVWVGQNVTLMGGVVLGDGCVVGQNSTVTKPVAPYSIVGGNPARLIRMRFPEDIIADLLQIKWWRYDFGQFKNIRFQDVREFIEGFHRIQPTLKEYPENFILFSQLLGEGGFSYK